MISKTFISRPKFALVISIVITIAGLISMALLPVNMYPQITPPQVQISASYPGASAQIVEESVIRPIEEQVNGVEDMMYIESTSSNNGTANITVYFKVGTDTDIAQVNVQNRVALAEAGLPEEVKRQGVSVKKKSSSMLLGINLYSNQENIDAIFLSNYATNYLTEPLGRINGVASAEVMGEQTYSMRLWLRPDRMASLGLTVSEVRAALQEQNTIVAAGKLGAAPSEPSQQFEYSIQAKGRLKTPEEFGQTIIRSSKDGNFVRLNDIARIELGAASYSTTAKLNQQDTAFIVIYQLTEANATQVAADVKARMAELAKQLPDGVEYSIPYDTTEFINRSIDEVVITLVQAVGLVILVVFLFLQNWRATLIPTVAIPVSLVGTFAFMMMMDYSINLITLFGLVLAIGIVVDDAIIVIENVERILKEEKLPIKEAVTKAMEQVSGPIVATTLVLLAVFVPVGFMPGITGELYKQFSVTISFAVLISSLNALTLSPALCALLLNEKAMKPIKWLAPFENIITRSTSGYSKVIQFILKRTARMALFAVVIFAAAGWLVKTVPTGFVPAEDQGFLFVDVQLPDAAASGRTKEVMHKLGDIVKNEPAATDFIAVSGFSLLGGAGSNNALGIVVLKDWEERTSPELGLRAVLTRLMGQFWAMPDAQIMAFNPPSIPGLGTSAGFEFRLQDSEGREPAELAQVLNGLIYEANQRPELSNVYSTFRANVPQYFLEIDRNKAKAQGVALSDIFLTLQAQLGSLYINDFNQFSRTYRVIMQAESRFRQNPADLQYYYVRNDEGAMVPLTTLAKLEPILGPTSLTHFNLYRSASISGQPAAGYASGDAIKAMQELAEQLPTGYVYEWAGQSKQEIEAGNMAPILFGLAVVFVYLFLVAQYESWTIPFSVIAAVPLALFGAMLALYVIGMENNIYAQVGLVLLIGLSTKTAILIVEFAMEERAAGKSIFEAALNAARLRFRAVLMTALSFVLGVLPLVFASGAGAGSRISLGITVLFGMLAATIFGTLLVPLFYTLVQSMREKIKGTASSE
ncbi:MULTISPECIES: multidrug efflux RND transporter permease subunit [unclassified Pseudoalteromonas]|uniref:efflux RND transporter permease subunit n=1 Tax=Pseudoalteromonas TaxID=53246 RepID=UPI000C8AADD2|nr:MULTISPECIES: multidrug efflux RND transporter permease subunit [unclassified Pseudoalteromonas]QLE08682.1 multidrug efflux RND transporter permease subunit [Pseudoalteromonas shioyasakiensis]MAD03094.1 hydrophobe/amphiphile efflux-1 family RND transporter [Pseudoalteromonas sp.]MCG9708818.1 multidrug efflux RND transporter permease subunit [Pseudoalteromonas sp. Isolate3]MCP4584535.1 multidrug efflux RND transporter permease subunit [Pseudoalteromonas sp.]NIZ05098.1 multidrug efflux RND tr|tara:strand:- start:30006 stop:33119 length:3114 start_codon:yes stop_codon:yes gene_type:complete